MITEMQKEQFLWQTQQKCCKNPVSKSFRLYDSTLGLIYMYISTDVIYLLSNQFYEFMTAINIRVCWYTALVVGLVS